MSRLTIYQETGEIEAEFQDYENIRQRLLEAGIVLERWSTEKALAENASPDEVLAAYDSFIQRVKKERGYVTVDVVSLNPQSPNIPELRAKFLDEHTHSEDEVRFFVDGTGMFYIHKNSRVYMILCEKGDFINLPAGTKHWFDMGPRPFFKAIRLFNNPEGWVAHYTGDKIADRFPKYEN
ncbi:MAG: acireductone dioxygenase [Leptospiraceae bacterium]|nr:acireductone dioxygenase [Leptospiraceae bacterium]MDW8307695.1 acireductone dioxygenase [Leptospiraceae bacterium]